MEKKQQNKKKTAPAASGSRYKVSEQTAAYIDCINGINELVDNIADAAMLQYQGTGIDEAMQPVTEAAIQLQEALLNLIKDSIRENIIYSGKTIATI